MGGRIHTIKIIPGSKKESDFMKLLDSVGVKHDLVMCKRGLIFETEYDEYIISDGLYEQISEKFEKLRGRPD